MRPATDLCWTCQKNNNKIHKSANLPEADKAEAVRAQEKHLNLASGEQVFYQTCCRESKDAIQNGINEIDFLTERQPCSFTSEQCTIPTNMHSSCIIRQIQINLGLFTLKLRERMPFLAFAAKQFHGKLTF